MEKELDGSRNMMFNLNNDDYANRSNPKGSVKVLVVATDKDYVEELQYLLEPYLIKVLPAFSEKEGIAAARELSPDVMIVDLIKPDLDGFRVCKEVRKFNAVPIIVLSAIHKPKIVAKALDLGADDYLVKPIKIDLLVANINKLARRRRAEGNIPKGSH